MAISLEELKEGKPLDSKKNNVLKNKSLRPWESHNDQDASIRTIGAVEAVKKARQIVQKNEEMIVSLHSNMNESDISKATDLLDSQQMRERLSERLGASLQMRMKDKVQRERKGNPRPPGFLNFLRHLFS